MIYTTLRPILAAHILTIIPRRAAIHRKCPLLVRARLSDIRTAVYISRFSLSFPVSLWLRLDWPFKRAVSVCTAGNQVGGLAFYLITPGGQRASRVFAFVFTRTSRKFIVEANAILSVIRESLEFIATFARASSNWWR